jgi:hypothetical protein
MGETFLEKWLRRINAAWAVLTGRAVAIPYENLDLSSFEDFD